MTMKKDENLNTRRPDKGDEFDREDLPEKIGSSLRQMYDDVLSEPVPNEFLSLLQQADSKKAGT